jgi:hypothetical protein
MSQPAISRVATHRFDVGHDLEIVVGVEARAVEAHRAEALAPAVRAATHSITTSRDTGSSGIQKLTLCRPSTK